MTMRNRGISMLVSFALVLSAAGVWAQDWPQWRGPNRDSKVEGFTAFKAWPRALTQKWTASVGSGISSPDLVVESSGHMRAYVGRAYLPLLVPTGASTADLR